MEAYRTRVAQLEQLVNQYTEEIVVQKHRLTEIKEEYHDIVQVRNFTECNILVFKLFYFRLWKISTKLRRL